MRLIDERLQARVVEEHVLGARVRRVDAVRVRAGVPVVDGVSYCTPGSAQPQATLGDLPPEVARLVGVADLAGGAHVGAPLAVVLDGAHELVGDADRVVRVLAADGVVGLAVEVGLVAGADERAGLLLLAHLPLDEVDDLRVVHVEADHLGRAARGAAALGGARGAVEDLEEAHQAARRCRRRRASPGLPRMRAEVGAGARAVLEEARLVLHEVVDRHQVVVDRSG